MALESNPLTIPAPGGLGNDVSTTASPIAVTNFTQPTSGAVALQPDGSFRYDPVAGYTGPASFTYTRGAAGTTTVDLSVNATTREASVFAGPRLASVASTRCWGAWSGPTWA